MESMSGILLKKSRLSHHISVNYYREITDFNSAGRHIYCKKSFTHATVIIC